jgi:hypothetical protein
MHASHAKKNKKEGVMATQLARMTEMLTRNSSARKMCTTAEHCQHVVVGVTGPRCQVEEEGVVARAAEVEGGIAEAGR